MAVVERYDSKRKWIDAGTLWLVALLALALFAMVNYLSFRHYQRLDWTSSKLYTLSEKTQSVLAGLDRKVELVIYLDPAAQLYAAADELLTGYAAANPAFVEKRAVDPAKNILEAQRLVERFNIERPNVIVVATEDDRRVIDEFDLAELDYSGAQFGEGPKLKAFKGEQLITSAILELVEAEKPRILFTTGHGEAPIDGAGDPRALSQARDLLGKDNFELESWDPTGETEVPEGTDLLVVAAPQTLLFEPELESFSRYLEAGGRMLVLLEPILQGDTLMDAGMGAWLARWGVEVGNDVVIDPASQMPFFGPETIYTDQFGFHPIVEDLEQTATRVFFSVARSVRRADPAPEGYEVTELVRTSDQAWAETDLSGPIDPDSRPERETVALGVAVSFEVGAPVEAEDGESGGGDTGGGEPDDSLEDGGGEEEGPGDGAGGDEPQGAAREARLVVYGDLDFAADSQIVNGANANLLLNTFNWLVQREQLISIAAKSPEETKLEMTGSELGSVFLMVMVLMPGLAVAVGVWVFLRRRR